jgi:DNA repair protein RadA/Sms
VAAALASSVFDRPVPADAVFVGELGLGGEIRPVGQVERRLAEAARMGFRTAYLSPRAAPQRLPRGSAPSPSRTTRALADALFPEAPAAAVIVAGGAGRGWAADR